MCKKFAYSGIENKNSLLITIVTNRLKLLNFINETIMIVDYLLKTSVN